ncbi:MAG TPA: OB-fold nucleic acid binding domain-containing protein, partial [Balneolaceae bacterium]|nr:OB-fold nucleic acid binding domain-containing protein [Balneolaceae bacterium]
YPHPKLEELLKPTYGIMIYQEQIMKAAQIIAGYSLGDADLLRRAMGKKKRKVMAEQRDIFVRRSVERGVKKEKAIEIFDMMAEFANYGFNKSHSAAYSVVAYQTAYFKANYPAEYMASILCHTRDNIDKVSKYIEECNHQNIRVDAPNINKGEGKFVAVDGRIQYGMEAIKNVGSNVVEELVKERNKNGKFESIFDFTARVDSHNCNKRSMESLVKAGAFDELEPNRNILLHNLGKILTYGSRIQELENSNQSDLFGSGGSATAIDEPKLEPAEVWSNIEKLKKERELIGFYLSGHPLSRFKKEIELFSTNSFNEDELEKLNDGTELKCICIITEVNNVTDRKGRPIAFIKAEDIDGNPMEIAAFSDVYDQYLGKIQVDNRVMIEGTKDARRGKLQIIAKSFERLESLREKMQHKLAVKIDIDTHFITEEALSQMAELFKSNKGETNVHFNVLSKKAKRPFAMHVRKFVIEPNSEVIDGLKELVGEDAVTLKMNN